MTTHHDRESPKHLYARIRAILIADWDPLGLSDAAVPPDDYDDMAREVHAILTGPEASVERVAAYLRWVEREQMHLQRRPGEATGAAKLLMALMDEAGEPDGR
ncbi:MAG TPA: hypothetical protein VLA52_11265 [Thermohalobaculum sp.]|nr:hypothetical protein [Thermohalobaculum sp.]